MIAGTDASHPGELVATLCADRRHVAPGAPLLLSNVYRQIRATLDHEPLHRRRDVVPARYAPIC